MIPLYPVMAGPDPAIHQNHESCPVPRHGPDKQPPQDHTPGALNRGDFNGGSDYTHIMNRPEKIDRPENPPEFARAVREGIGDADAGRTLSYEKIRRWLLSWGQEKEMPPPE